jgi:glyoxylase-like metal-dependent hydrolase (beta-lactamase superfamily II)
MNGALVKKSALGADRSTRAPLTLKTVAIDLGILRAFPNKVGQSGTVTGWSKTVKRVFTLVLGLWMCGAFSVRAAAPEDGGLDVVKVRKNFYMIAGAGGNIAVQIGSDGVVLVNSGSAAASELVLATVKTLTDLPIRYIINVDAGADFVGGNETLSRAGYTIFTNTIGANAGAVAAMMNGGGASILSHDSVLRRMSSGNAPYPSGAWPNEAFFTPRKAFRMNDEGIEVLYQPAAHSNADSFVLFRSSDVVVTGDVMDITRFPVIDLANGGSIQGEIDALNRLIDLTIASTPFIYKDVGTYVIPGHGRLCEQMEVVDYRDMVVLVRDVVADLITQGKTLDQIKAARPALPYETRYGSETGPWTTNAFIEAVYKSLKATPP